MIAIANKVAPIYKHFLEEKEGGIKKVLFYLYTKTFYYINLSLQIILTLPIACLLVALRPIVKIYLVMMETSRIGHFSENTELMLIRQNNIPARKRELVLFYFE